MEVVNNSGNSLNDSTARYFADLPESCPFYKFLLVEELFTRTGFEQLHVGKCSVIGKLLQNSEGDFELENLRLPQLPSEFAHPEGTVSVRLLDFDVFPSSDPLKSGRFCEACGEVVLFNVESLEQSEKKLLSTYELHLKLRQLETLEEQLEYLEELQKTHRVGLKLHFSKEVERAADLVEYNLALRQFCPQECVQNLEVAPESICDIAEAAKESSWYEFWYTQGNENTLHAWKLKYKDYIDESKVDKVEEQVNESTSELTENKLESVETSSTQQESTIETSLTWQELWDEYTEAVYCEQYKVFENIYENYYWNLKEALQEIPRSKKLESEHIEIQTEFELLKLAGLPTAFGKGNNITKRKNNDKPKATEQIEFLESSDTEYSDCDYSDENENESALEMPPFKKSSPNHTAQTESDNDENLHKIINKTIARPKHNKLLRNVPQFMMEDKSMLKYWKKRFSLFSLFDEGIKLDKESWFSVTPEKVAQHMAKRMACDVIIDGFCGSGGNAIQFAMTCKKVIAIDIDPLKVEMARHNAGIYGVANKIEFIVGDFLELCKSEQLQGDVVFLSPPWGGPKYTKLTEYDIETKLEPVGASELVEVTRKISNNIACFLPRNSKIKQIIRLAGLGNSCEIEHNYLGTRLIGLTAFYGEYFKKEV